MDLSKINILSLASGGGGLDLGVEAAIRRLGRDPRHVAYVEIEAYACAILASRMEAGHLAPAPIWTDIRSFDSAAFRGVVDLIVGGYPCFATGTRILTEFGHLPIEDVRVGDRVLTHRGRWRRVTARMVREDAPLWRVDAQGVPGVVTTEEHPFLSRRRERDGGWSGVDWVRAADLAGRHVAQVLPPVRPDDHTLPFWWVVGRYLADGWRQKAPSHHCGRVNICCARDEADDLSRRIAAAGFHAYRSEERTTPRFAIVNKSLYEFLAQFGEKAHGKRLPRRALELDAERAGALLDGLCSGDGYRDTAGEHLVTVSRSLALGAALLAQRARGVVASVRRQATAPHTRIEGREVNQRDWYRVTIPRSNRSACVGAAGRGWKKVRSVVSVGLGTVYNLAVDEDESYCADGAVVHNCQPFSHAGKRRGADDPRHLWPFIANHIREIQPRAVFFENVGGHLSLGAHEVIRELQEMGYATAAGLFTAEEVGAPHKRERIFILGRDVADAQDHGPCKSSFAHRDRALECAVAGAGGGTGGGADSTGIRHGGEAHTRRTADLRSESRDGVGDATSVTERESRHAGLRTVGDADFTGWQGWGLRRRERPDERAPRTTGGSVGDGDAPLDFVPFPPRPDDRDGWSEYLARWPGLEPAIRRGADGMANRVDRIRALGNGAVLGQVEYAFLFLLRSIIDSIRLPMIDDWRDLFG